jgi:hypothetical protein
MISLFLILLSFAFLGPPRQLETQDLRLTVKIAAIKGYCANGPNFHQLQLRLELIFTNDGSGVLIIQKRSLAEIEYSRHADSEEELTKSPWGNTFWITSDSGDVTNIGNRPDGSFAVLKPGQSYRVRTDFNLISAKPLLLGKETYLQVIAPMWSGTRQQAEKVQKKWEKIGVLCFKSLKSVPMPFMLNNQTKVKKCS